jgi:uncharacterized membrane protein YfcA
VDIKLAGSLSLAVSLPTILVGLYKYSRHTAFGTLTRNRKFIAFMAAGSILGAFIGSFFLGTVPQWLLKVALGIILLISAYKLFHKKIESTV